MDDPRFVRAVERGKHVIGDADGFGDGHLLPRQALRESLARHVLHHDARGAVFFDVVEDVRHVRVRDLRSR